MASFAAQAGAPNVRAVAKPRAILFDAFPIFDPRSVKASVEQHAPNAPRELYELWRSRTFEYQWLHALSGTYVDFESCLAEALDFAAATLNGELSSAQRRGLVDAYSDLRTWDDVGEGLAALAA